MCRAVAMAVWRHAYPESQGQVNMEDGLKFFVSRCWYSNARARVCDTEEAAAQCQQ
jgi:hypothetical protein